MLFSGSELEPRSDMSLTHFITAPTFHHKRIFQNERYGDLLTDVVMHWRQKASVQVHDYVVMPDHVHLLITLRKTEETASALRQLKDKFAEELRAQFGYDGEVWDAGFGDQIVETAEQSEECARHIHSNPVRVGYCDSPGEYRMSSRSSRWVLDPLPEKLRAPALTH